MVPWPVYTVSCGVLLQLSFLMTSPVTMTSRLLLAADGCDRDCCKYVLQQRHVATDSTTFLVRLPAPGLYKFQVGLLVDPWFRHHLKSTERDATATREAGVNFELYMSSQ